MRLWLYRAICRIKKKTLREDEPVKAIMRSDRTYEEMPEFLGMSSGGM